MCGFWLGQWNEREGRSEVSPRTLRLTHHQARLAMYATLGAMAAGGDLLAPAHRLIAMEDYR